MRKKIISIILLTLFLLVNIGGSVSALDLESVKGAVNSHKNNSAVKKEKSTPKKNKPVKKPDSLKVVPKKKIQTTKIKPKKKKKPVQVTTVKKKQELNAPPADILVARARGKRMADPKEAINLCKRALQYEPYNVGIFELIGNIHWVNLNELPQAKWWFEKALKYNRNSKNEKILKERIRKITVEQKAIEEQTQSNLIERAKEKNRESKNQEIKKEEVKSNINVPTLNELMKLK